MGPSIITGPRSSRDSRTVLSPGPDSWPSGAEHRFRRFTGRFLEGVCRPSAVCLVAPQLLPGISISVAMAGSSTMSRNRLALALVAVLAGLGPARADDDREEGSQGRGRDSIERGFTSPRLRAVSLRYTTCLYG